MSLKPTNLSKVKDLLGVQGRNIKAIKSQTGVLKVGVLDRNDPANVEIAGKTQKDGGMVTRDAGFMDGNSDGFQIPLVMGTPVSSSKVMDSHLQH